MITINFTEFRNNASEFFTKVEQGETLLIMRHGKLVAEISPPIDVSKEPAWKQSGIKLKVGGKSLSEIILEEREAE